MTAAPRKANARVGVRLGGRHRWTTTRLFDLLDARERAMAGGIVLLAMLVRIVVVVAVELALHDRLKALGVTVALGMAFAAQTALVSMLRARISAFSYAGAIDALLGRDFAGPPTATQEEAESTVWRGVQAAETIGGQIAPQLAGDIGACVILALMAAITEPPRILAIAGGAALVAAVTVVSVHRKTGATIANGWKAATPVLEAIVVANRGQVELVASGFAAAFRAKARKRIAAFERARVRTSRVMGFAGRAPTAGAVVGLAVVLSIEYARTGLSPASALARLAFFAAAAPAFLGVARGFNELSRQLGEYEAAEWIRTSGPPIQREGSKDIPCLPAPIAFRSVRYAYPDGETEPTGSPRAHVAVDGLSFVWEPGVLMVLRGLNGAGKSTCIKLLLGLLVPDGGTITIGGVDLAELDVDAWRRHVGFLSQRPYLPEKISVRNALCAFASDASDEVLRAALERVGLYSQLALRTPEPLDLPMRALSMGQRQRVALARVIARRPSVLLLDEPDANLDLEGISVLQDLLVELKSSTMVLVVAHAPELIKLGDVVIDLTSA
jgi:ABC-type multidrug transport system fused ATPase/permease subunit